MRQVILDTAKVRDLMGTRLPFEIAAASGKISGHAVRRTMNGLPVTPTIASHLADALGAKLPDLVVREVEADVPGRR